MTETVSGEWRSPGKKPPVVDRRCAIRDCCQDKGEYRMLGGCYNCGSELLGLFTKAHMASGGACPVCGCARLHWDRLA